ncbi:MAG TPA: hypothetical protein VMW27_00460 [Thermoanaerobaculia bacterium]|nr:hypothetical protein [Thermoanaerobaculia bacterium]
MRKKLLLLALALTAAAASLPAPSAEALTCPRCCRCNSAGIPIVCTHCPPPGEL